MIALLVVTLIFSRLFIPDSYLSEGSSQTGLFALFGVSNFQLIVEPNGYFGAVTDFNPYVHTWSLGVEEQFYVIFPLILFLEMRLSVASKPVVARCGSLLLPALLILSLGFSVWETKEHPDRAYFMLTSRFWELAAGSSLCLAHSKGRLLPRTVGRSLALVLSGLVGIGVGLFFTVESLFPFPWAIAPVLGTVACLAGVVVPAHRHLLARLLSLGPVTYLGRISYSLYLWHWPVIVLLRWTVGLESPATIAVAMAATVVLGSLSYHAIEQPFQRLRLLRDQLLRVVLFETKVAQAHGRLLFTLPTNLLVVGLGLLVIMASSYIFRRIERSPRLPLSVTMKRGLEPNPWRADLTSLSGSLSKSGCQGRWSDRTLIVLGDSHAGALGEAAGEVMKETGASVYLFTKGGANLGSLIRVQTEVDRSNQRRILDELRTQSRQGDVVLLSALRVHVFCTQWKKFEVESVIRERDSEKSEQIRRLAVQEGCELIRELKALGLVVVIQAPMPVLLSPPFRCSDWFNRMNPIGDRGFLMDRKFLLEHRSAAMRSIKEVQEKIPEVKLWDPFPVLCPDPVCSAFDGDKPLFFDGDHLSSHGNQKLYPDLVRFLSTIWGGNISSSIGRMEKGIFLISPEA